MKLRDAVGLKPKMSDSAIKAKDDGAQIKMERSQHVILHASHDEQIHPVNLDLVRYARVVQEQGGGRYTQLIFDKDDWINVRETYEEIFGILKSIRRLSDQQKSVGFVSISSKV